MKKRAMTHREPGRHLHIENSPGENSRSLMNPYSIAGRHDKRRLTLDASDSGEPRDLAFRRVIFSIPSGKVSTYGKVAAAAGYPRLHRAVARLLSSDAPDQLPWHRVLGAGGEIKLSGTAAREQRARLRLEGVKFKGERVDMERFEYSFIPQEAYD